jgi:chromosomal replication initiation ATPase DnaA
MTPQTIKEVVANAFKCRVKDIEARTRRQPVALARQVCFYFCRKRLKMTLEAIAETFDRHYTGVHYGINAVQDLLSYNQETADRFDEIEKALKSE